MPSKKNYLAHCILCDGVIHRNAIIEISDNGEFEIMPFETETANTIFISGIIIVSDQSVRNPVHQQNIVSIAQSSPSLTHISQQLNDYLISQNLYNISHQNIFSINTFADMMNL